VGPSPLWRLKLAAQLLLLLSVLVPLEVAAQVADYDSNVSQTSVPFFTMVQIELNVQFIKQIL